MSVELELLNDKLFAKKRLDFAWESSGLLFNPKRLNQMVWCFNFNTGFNHFNMKQIKNKAAVVLVAITGVVFNTYHVPTEVSIVYAPYYHWMISNSKDRDLETILVSYNFMDYWWYVAHNISFIDTFQISYCLFLHFLIFLSWAAWSFWVQREVLKSFRRRHEEHQWFIIMVIMTSNCGNNASKRIFLFL